MTRSKTGSRFSVTSGCLIAATLLSSVALSQASTTMHLKGQAVAPKAFYQFCKRDPGNCNSTSGAKIVNLTPARQRELTAVNAAINQRIREVSDVSTKGVADDWRQGAREGDCEDFAIAKKNALMKRGWPASALLLTVARERFGPRGHTVLTVRTSKGDLVLDNRSRSVMDWSQTGYRYHSRQSQQATGEWELIGK